MFTIIGLNIENNFNQDDFIIYNKKSFFNTFLSYILSYIGYNSDDVYIKDTTNKKYILYLIDNNNNKFLVNLSQINYSNSFTKGSYGIWQAKHVLNFYKNPKYIPCGKPLINLNILDKNIEYFECLWFTYSYDGFDRSIWKYNIHEDTSGFVKININNFIDKDIIKKYLLNTSVHFIADNIIDFL